MRLRTLNRLSQVSSAVVTTLLDRLRVVMRPKPQALTPGEAYPVTGHSWTSPRQPRLLAPNLLRCRPRGHRPSRPRCRATLPRHELPSTTAGDIASDSGEPPRTDNRTNRIPPVADAPLPTDPQQIEADVALAEQLDGIAEIEFANKINRAEMWPLVLRHQAALLSACATLNPSEARFLRLIADAMVQLHDRDGELEALRKAIVADQNDEVSWNRRLDLILAPMQTARQKIDYLRRCDEPNHRRLDAVPADVRRLMPRFAALRSAWARRRRFGGPPRIDLEAAARTLPVES